MHLYLLPPILKTTRFVPLPIMSAYVKDFKMSEGKFQVEPFITLSQFLKAASASGFDSMYSNIVLSLIKWIFTV